MGKSFTNSNVHNQLAKPQIYIPLKAAFAHAKPGTEIPRHLEQYAAQQMLTGEQAEAYADHFIAVPPLQNGLRRWILEDQRRYDRQPEQPRSRAPRLTPQV